MLTKIRYLLVGILGLFVHACLVLAVQEYAGFSNNSYFLIIILVAIVPIYWTSRTVYRRSIRWGPRIKEQLAMGGLKLLNERPLKLKEALEYLDWTPRVTVMVNNIPIDSVGKTFAHRIIEVLNDNQQRKTLCVEIMKSDYSGKIVFKTIKEL
ncbi:hypothetical protein [Pontibacter liquoris]|uniref:hypothetical protein n=1 Tax=Pontibacter liquoris TaxID=2905677 RepID=UPI001FA76565|nr:hypothetical protein [Pontibacter liquoris]